MLKQQSPSLAYAKDDKRQSQLTSAVALGAIFAIGARVLAMTIEYKEVPIFLLGTWITLLIAFGLSRTQYYRIASSLIVLAIFAIPYVFFHQPYFETDNSPLMLAFAINSVVVSFLFFNIRGIGLIVIANLLALIITTTTTDQLVSEDVALVFGINTLAFLLIFVATIARYNDRKRLETQTRIRIENETRYRTLFEAAFESLIIHDTGKIIAINPAAEKLFGYTNTEIKHKYLYDLITDTLSMPSVEAWEDGELIPYESVGLKSDGTVVPIEVFTKPFSYDGTDVRISAVRDITLHKQSKAQMHKRVQLEQLIGAISRRFTGMSSDAKEIEAIIKETLKDIGEYVGVDRSFAFLCFDEADSNNHYTYEWVTDKQNVAIDISGILPSSMWEWWQADFQSGEKVIIPNIESLPPDTDEKIRTTLQIFDIQSSLILPLRFQETLRGFIGFATTQEKNDWSDEDVQLLNITAEIFINAIERTQAEDARQRADRWFSKIFHNSPLPIAITRVSDSEFLDVNDSFVELVGYTRDEIINRTTHQLGLWEITEGNPWKTQEVIITGAFTNLETRLKTKDDDLRDVLISIENVDLNGEDSMIVIISDVTGLKQAQANERAYALEREQVEILHRFIGEVSHDFKTPLSTMRANTYLIEKKLELGQPVQENLDTLNIQFDQLQRLLDGLLTMSRLDQINTSDFEFNLYDLNTLIRESVNNQHILATEKNHNIHFELADFDKMIPIDSNAISRAIGNVLVNAYIYTPQHGDITIRTQLDDNYAIIEIIDNGLGIPESDLAFIFNRFYKVNKARTSGTSGTGLGLPIARRIIEAHHGYITATSTPDHGSTFKIALPFNHELARLRQENADKLPH